MTAGLPLMTIVFTPLTKGVLQPFELSGAMSATDAAIRKKIYGSVTRALINSNEEMAYITKVVKSLDKSGLLTKETSKTIKNETKE